jgi:aldose 1-epimerase
MAGVSAPSPSGRQIELAHGDQRATVVEVGGGLRTYVAGDRVVLDGYPEDAMCTAARGQVLMPWPNRIAGGRYSFGGETQQLAITEPSRSTAIHGLVRWVAWKVFEVASDRVVMEHRVHPQPGYPFDLDLSVEYALDRHGLTVSARAINTGATACPFGAGFHPYLSPEAPTIDDTPLQLPAKAPDDFLATRLLGDTVLDTCFSDLVRDDDGKARVEFGETVLWVDEGFGYLMVFTGDTLGPAERRRGLAVEPMTCAPDAFNNGEGRIVLEPGQTWASQWGIAR